MTGRKILPITNDMLVGEFAKELSYQFAKEKVELGAKQALAGADVPQRRERDPWKKNRRLLCEMDSRYYFRIQQEVDPNFFSDSKNIRDLIVEHPEIKGGVGR